LDLEQIYREQYRSLVGFIAKRTGDRARAEELAQEAFVRAIRSRPRHPRSWLYAVAANLVRDDARRAGVARQHLRVVRQEAERDRNAPAADTAWTQNEDAARLRAALAALAERDRDALLLKEDGLSYDEIAERLGLSRGSIGTTLARARQRLVSAWEGGREASEDAAR